VLARGVEAVVSKPVILAAGATVTVTVTMPPGDGVGEPIAAGVDPLIVPGLASGVLALDEFEARKLDADAEVVTGMMVRDEVGAEPLPGICRTSPTLIWNAGPVTWGFAASRAARVIPLLCAIAAI
jgi:hypothetical protein